jgi:hypothetical protein
MKLETTLSTRLPPCGAAGDEDVEPGLDTDSQQLGDRLGQGPEADEIGDPVGLPGELADGQGIAVHCERRDHRIHPGSVAKPRIDHRRRLVDAPSHQCDDPVDDPAQVAADEPGWSLKSLPSR